MQRCEAFRASNGRQRLSSEITALAFWKEHRTTFSFLHTFNVSLLRQHRRRPIFLIASLSTWLSVT